MSRLVAVLAPACLGAFLFASTGCEDQQCKDSLSASQNEVTNLKKTSATQETKINGLKDQLNKAQAKVDELTKESEALKAGKGPKAKEDKGKTAEGTKAEPAKAEKKGKKDTKK